MTEPASDTPIPARPAAPPPFSDSAAEGTRPPGLSSAAPKRWWRLGLKILHHPLPKLLLALVILAWLHHKGKLNFGALSQITRSWGWLLLGTACMLPSFLIASFRFKIVLGGIGLPCSFKRALTWTMIGEFWNVAMPGTGGDLWKAWYAAQHYGKGRRGVAALSVLLDRLLGLLGLLFFALLACLFGGSAVRRDPRLLKLSYLLMAICLGTLFFLLLLASRKFQESRTRERLMGWLPRRDKFEKIYQGFAQLGRRPGSILLILLLSLLNHSVWTLSLLALSRGLGLGFDVSAALVVIPVALFLNVFGFAGGFGVGEVAFEYLFFHLLGTLPGSGTNLAFAFHVLALALRFIVGLPFYLLGGRGAPGVEWASILRENDKEKTAG